MKFRNGFVSNSSSSSFVLKKKSPSISKKELINLLNEDYKGDILIHGMELSDGDDWFWLDSKMARYIKSYPDRFLKNADIQGIYLNPSYYEDNRKYNWDTDTYETELGDGEELVYSDRCSCDDMEYERFLERYILSPEEYNEYEYEYSDFNKIIIAYKEKYEVCPADITDLYLGMNEFAGSLDEVYDAAFSYKKIEPKDVPFLDREKNESTYFYRDLKIIKNNRAYSMDGKYHFQIVKCVTLENSDAKSFFKEG